MKQLLFLSYFLLFVPTGFAAVTPQKAVRKYHELKTSKLTVRKKADTLFIYVLGLQAMDKRIADSIQKDYTAAGKSSGNSYWIAKSHIAAAFAFLNAGDYQQGIISGKRAVRELDEAANPKDASFAHTILANCYERTHNQKKGFEHAFIALQFAEQAKEPVLIANTLNFIGLSYSKEKKYTLAKKYFLRYMRLAQKSQNQGILFTAYTNLGINAKNLNQPDAALYFHRKALEIAEKNQNNYNIAFAKSDLGNLLLIREQYAEAIPLLQEATQLREEIGENWEIGYTYNFLGEAYSRSNRKQIAEITFHKAIGTSQLNENLKQRYESYEALSKHFERFGQYDSALFYHQKFAFLQDSLMREHEKASTAGIIANYEFEKKQSTIVNLRKKNENQQFRLASQQRFILATIFVILLLAVSLVLLYKNRQQRLQRQALQARIQEEELRRENEEKLRKDRERISKELHDNIGSNLIFIKQSIQTLASTQDSTGLKDLTDETIRDLRQSVWLMNHPRMSLIQWVTKLREYFQFSSQIKLTLEANDESIMLESPVVTALYRIVKEAVNNAIKYSEATEIRVWIQQTSDTLYLTVADNGIGIQGDSQGMGLGSMQDRVHELQGTIQIESANQVGTTISISIPL